MCARFLSHLLLLYNGRVHGAISGCTVLLEVHPVSAQNKSLISDTDGRYHRHLNFFFKLYVLHVPVTLCSA